MTMTTDLTPLLKHLKLGAMLNTLPERIALARREQLDYASFLEIILSRRGQPPRSPAHRDEAAPSRLPGDLPLGGLRLVGVDYPGPPAS